MSGFLAYRLPQAPVQLYQIDFEPAGPDENPTFRVTSFEQNQPALSARLVKTAAAFPANPFYNHALPHAISRYRYEQMVKQAVNEIQAAGMKKVVLSRCHPVTRPAGFNLQQAFNQLCNAYPDCFVCLVSSPQTGTWLGASPELLWQRDTMQVSTMALAGTRTGHGKWGPKETDEQQLVTDFIADTLTQNHISLTNAAPPEELAMGNLIHRVSYLKGITTEGFSEPELLSSLAPTPAVCGLPVAAARQFIGLYEGYARELYSGYWGICSVKFTSLYVNLRCVQVMAENLVFYAGAGITAGSLPQQEWLETEAKMQLLASLLL